VPTTAVLLAAGGGTRFAGPSHKLLAPLDGRPVYRHAVDHVLAALERGIIDDVVIVTGAVDLDLSAIAGTVIVAHNEHWEHGQAGSLQLGIAEAARQGSDAVVVGLADQPFVPASAWRAVATSPSAKPIVVATYAGERGPNPVRLHRDVWPMLPQDGDEGARPLMRLHPDWIDEVACEGSAADIDTLEDLGQWTSF
jgi:CTP:molybdopterin cytidylyltransferase MocA